MVELKVLNDFIIEFSSYPNIIKAKDELVKIINLNKVLSRPITDSDVRCVNVGKKTCFLSIVINSDDLLGATGLHKKIEFIIKPDLPNKTSSSYERNIRVLIQEGFDLISEVESDKGDLITNDNLLKIEFHEAELFILDRLKKMKR